METVTLVVLIPVGPTCDVAFTRDTVESVVHFTTRARVIIVLDDSGKGTGAALQRTFPELVILQTPQNYGKHAGLYLNVSAGFRHAFENYSFNVLLRLDTDALVIGSNPEQAAVQYFRQHPEVGILGSFRTDCNGDPRDFSWPRRQLAKESRFAMVLTHPGRLRGVLLLRELLRRSKQHGYEPGEHCLGGAYFISRDCIAALLRQNLLSRREIFWSRLQEDHVLGLLIHAVGLRHADFATGSLPMGLRWRGLPSSPEDLVGRGKKIVHSTRFFNGLSEQTIREFFRQDRSSITR
jgi:hypothetical protein